MNTLLTSITPQQLRQAAEIKEQIDALQAQLTQLLEAPAAFAPATAPTLPRKRTMSPLAKARIAAAARARWARIKGAGATSAAPTSPKRALSPAGRARISAAARARWAKFRSAAATSPAAPQFKSKMTPAGKASLSAKMKAIWAARRAAK